MTAFFDSGVEISLLTERVDVKAISQLYSNSESSAQSSVFWKQNETHNGASDVRIQHDLNRSKKCFS